MVYSCHYCSIYNLNIAQIYTYVCVDVCMCVFSMYYPLHQALILHRTRSHFHIMYWLNKGVANDIRAGSFLFGTQP